MRQLDLTEGSIVKKLLLFAFPLIVGNILQQLYNIVDTLIVGRFLGTLALAAVGSSYSLMTFLTSILLGLCLGSGAVFAIRYGERREEVLREELLASFVGIGGLGLLLTTLVFALGDNILYLLKVPSSVFPYMKEYLLIIYFGLMATFFYNYFASALRAIGNSLIPLVVLALSAVVNIVLDLVFILFFDWGVGGAALATVIAQWLSAFALGFIFFSQYPSLNFLRAKLSRKAFASILGPSLITSAQQSVMNFGILMVQGLVNSFGAVIMAAFAAGVKIDSLAYMPLQDFGNAFSVFIGQNYGASKEERIKKGRRIAFALVTLFSLLLSLLVFVFAPSLLGFFVASGVEEVLREGVRYLRVEGAFYLGIGFLFLYYGLFRALKRPEVSLMLTIISLGLRVILAYTLSSWPSLGVMGIWISVPIGWVAADAAGFLFDRFAKKKTTQSN